MRLPLNFEEPKGLKAKERLPYWKSCLETALDETARVRR
jgi:hypothetical protein